MDGGGDRVVPRGLLEGRWNSGRQRWKCCFRMAFGGVAVGFLYVAQGVCVCVCIQIQRTF